MFKNMTAQDSVEPFTEAELKDIYKLGRFDNRERWSMSKNAPVPVTPLRISPQTKITRPQREQEQQKSSWYLKAGMLLLVCLVAVSIFNRMAPNRRQRRLCPSDFERADCESLLIVDDDNHQSQYEECIFSN